MSREEIVVQVLSDHFGKLRNNLENLRSMLQDLVLAVPQTPDAEKLARAVLEALPQPEAPEFVAPPPEPAPPPPPPPPPAPALNNLLLYHAAAIEYASGQADVLNALLKGAENFAKRGVLFVVRNDAAMAWNSFGFDNPEETKRWKAALDKDPILTTVLGSRTRILLDNAKPSFIPDSLPVVRSLLSPLLLKGKVLAFLYADSGRDGKLDHYSIDLLMKIASLTIDIFPLRPKRDPLPPVLENQDIVLPAEVPLAPPAREDAALLFEDTGTLAAQPEPEELPTAQTIMAEIPSEAEAPPASPAPLEAVELESGEYARPAAEEAAPPPPPPPPPEPEEVPIPPGEERLHADAERFAKLLVQEIALYHPKELEQGRRQGNLYALLREDIERSREAFESRFQKPSIRSRDYFGKALVKYLADGDPSRLGN